MECCSRDVWPTLTDSYLFSGYGKDRFNLTDADTIRAVQDATRWWDAIDLSSAGSSRESRRPHFGELDAGSLRQRLFIEQFGCFCVCDDRY